MHNLATIIRPRSQREIDLLYDTIHELQEKLFAAMRKNRELTNEIERLQPPVLDMRGQMPSRKALHVFVSPPRI